MSSSALAAGIRRLRGQLAAQQSREDSDEQLLHAFTERRDDSAFAVLVRRHGPMVLRVCRRVLGHEQDAEDAFQAAFLVLARNASALRKQTSLASFLHGIAYRTAMKAKQSAARRRKHEGQAPARPPADPADEPSWREARALLDEEIARLPEIYRIVFVLFYLEDLGRDETARRLGLKDATVAKRLAEARKRLQKQLARRGVELTAVLAAMALVTPSVSALPAGLMAKTMEAVLATVAGKELAAVVSASVAELVKGATAGMMASKAKMATVVLLTMSLLTVATSGSLVSWYGRASGPLAATPGPLPAKADDKPKTATPKHEAAKTVEIQGRVLDADDKPVKGARLHWPRFKKDLPKAEERLEWLERGRSDEEGRFRISLKGDEDLDDSLRKLVATADGYGVTWVELPKAKAPEKVTVRLRKDVTIRGRIVSMEGRPLAGARVRVATLEEMPNGRFDDYLAFWEQDWNKTFGKTRWLQIPFKQSILSAAIADRKGCFQLSGVGTERIVQLEVRGEGIAHVTLPIVARPGFDPSALNKSARSGAAMMLPNHGQPPVLYSPTFDYVAAPARIVAGVVREAGSGKPVPGVHIYAGTDYRSNSEAFTDKEGRYRLEGLPKVKRYIHISAIPPWDSPWLTTSLHDKEAAEGLQPVQVDFTLNRGVVLTGRLIDRATGKGVVASSIMFDLLPDNKFAGKPGYDPSADTYNNDAEGRFRIKVVPGTGVLKAGARGAINPFMPAQFDAKDRKRVTLTAHGDFTTFGGGTGFLSLYNVVKWLDLAADAGVVEQDLYLERGATAKVRIHDPQGKPLSGVIVSGIDAIPGQHYEEAYIAAKGECTVVALDPQHPRQVIFYHAERRLAGTLIVRGDEKEPLTVRLAPTGIVTGRVKNADGQPLQGVEVEAGASGPSTSTSLSYLYSNLNHTHLPVRTDKEGRFRLEGVVADGKFAVLIRRHGAYLDGGQRTKELRLKASETLDLGDIRLRPQR